MKIKLKVKIETIEKCYYNELVHTAICIETFFLALNIVKIIWIS